MSCGSKNYFWGFLGPQTFFRDSSRIERLRKAILESLFAVCLELKINVIMLLFCFMVVMDVRASIFLLHIMCFYFFSIDYKLKVCNSQPAVRNVLSPLSVIRMVEMSNSSFYANLSEALAQYP